MSVFTTEPKQQFYIYKIRINIFFYLIAWTRKCPTFAIPEFQPYFEKDRLEAGYLGSKTVAK